MSPATAEGGARDGIAGARGILAALVGPLAKMIQTYKLLTAISERNLGVSGLSDTRTLFASVKSTSLFFTGYVEKLWKTWRSRLERGIWRQVVSYCLDYGGW